MTPMSDSDNDGWEQVVPENSCSLPLANSNTIEITLQAPPVKKSPEKSEKSKRIQAERVIRVESHKLHTICLLKSACIRNKWLNDPLLHARLLSLTPLNLQNAFSSITRKRIPDNGRRGRVFESTVMQLTQWWRSMFELEHTGHIRSRTFKQAQEDMENETLSEESEVLRSSNSLMKRALMRRGSRDSSSMLFAALCRALSIPTRLVVSLQSVPWKASVGKEKTDAKGKGKGRATSVVEEQDSDDDDMEEVGIPDFEEGSATSSPYVSASSAFEETPKPSGSKSSGSLRKHIVKTRRRKTYLSNFNRQDKPPISGWPPTIWVEVFSRADFRWMPVDPVRYIVNKKKLMEPPTHDKNNRMAYVVAIEEDGYARDVTRRYAREYQGKTIKSRVGVRNGQQEWWSEVMSMLARPYPLQRDEIEDDEFELAQYREGMPTSLAGFKNHPSYVLERHLKQTEVIYPKEEVGKFRGESVYSRTSVLSLKTSENWTRMGRQVKEGCQPLKMVKAHAMTINRRRAIEMARSQGEEMTMQGLYALDQTELYVPDPVINGKVPRNDFGNIDLYTPSMLPEGGVHIPFQGVAKVAKALGVDYAEAVTSFEFRQGRAFPVLTGIVVAAENEEMVVEAYLESAQNEEEKRRIRTREKVIKLWSKVINGLRIQQRIQNQYGGGGARDKTQQSEPSETAPAGGFITDADRSVVPFTLPRSSTSLLDPGLQSSARPQEEDKAIGFDFSLTPALPPTEGRSENAVEDEAEIFDESEFSAKLTRGGQLNGTPITMQDLAESERIRVKQQIKARDARPGPGNRVNNAIRQQARRSIRSKGNSHHAEISASDEDGNDNFGDLSQDQHEDNRRTKRARLSSNSATSTPTRRSLRPRAQRSQADLEAERKAEEELRKVLGEVDDDA